MLNRSEALNVLREIADCNLVDPSWVSLIEVRRGIFQIKIKGSTSHSLSDLIAAKNLSLKTESNYILISKPQR